MKKTLLLIAMSVPFTLMAQQGEKTDVSKIEKPLVKSMNGEYRAADKDAISLAGLPSINEDINASAKRKAAEWVTIGITTYDLQTNASIGRRLQLHSDGTVTAVWTTAAGLEPYPDRGTGLNYFNGTDWRAPVSTRLEPATGADNRTGWPNIAVINDGTEREIVMGHVALSDFGGFRTSTNSGIGKEDWTTATSNVLTGNPQIPGRPIWGRMATDGALTVHIIANYADSSSDQPFTTVRKGVRDPMTYSRSEDGGETWIVDKMMLPDYDSTLILEGGGDQYAIDVRGDVVAIFAGGLNESLVLWKSTDAGQNFTKIDVEPFPFAPYRANKIIGTNVPTNDGSLDVIIDNNDNVHCFWGFSQVTQRDISPDSAIFVPGSNKLMHWDEVNNSVDSIAGVWDRNENNQLDIVIGTIGRRATFDPNTGNPIGAARYGNTSLTTMPSVAIDASGNLYCVYSAPVEDAITDDNENYRDIYVVYSTDGGATWVGPQNLTDQPIREDVFACVAKKADDFLHVIFQRDEFPGTELQNQDPAGSNDIKYGAIPTSEILANNIGTGTKVGVNEVVNDAKVFVVSQNYPNPFSNETNVTLYLNQGGDLNLTVVNTMGQVVKTADYEDLNNGTHNLVIDGSDLAPGIYFYSLTINGSTVTKRMQVK